MTNFVLATLDEAAPSLARLRAALAGEQVQPGPEAPSGVLGFVRQHPGALLCEVAEGALLSVVEAEAQLRALARTGAVQAATSEDGITRWWPVEAPP